MTFRRCHASTFHEQMTKETPKNFFGRFEKPFSSKNQFAVPSCNPNAPGPWDGKPFGTEAGPATARAAAVQERPRSRQPCTRCRRRCRRHSATRPGAARAAKHLTRFVWKSKRVTVQLTCKAASEETIRGGEDQQSTVQAGREMRLSVTY